jgi:hypothetical protein
MTIANMSDPNTTTGAPVAAVKSASHLDTGAKTADSTTDPSTPDRPNEPGTGQNLTRTDTTN